MIKILAPQAYCKPELMASSHLWDHLDEAFAKNGLHHLIYAPTPTRGVTAEVREEYKKRKREEIYDGKLIINRFSLYGEGKNPLLRAVRYFLFCFISLWKCLHGKDAKGCNVIYSVSTPPIIGSMSAMVKKRRGIPFVYVLQDIFPDSLVATGLTHKGSLLWKIGRKIENFTYRHADKIIVISEDFKKNIMAKGVPEEKIVVVYNWVDQNAVVDVKREDNKLFDMYGLDRSKFYVTYNGNIGLSQNMDMLLNVASDFQGSVDDIHFVLVGNGAYLEEVKRMVEEKDLKNVHLLPFQPYEDISHVFSLGDVSLVISKPGTGAASVPSKTWSIMSASRPVLANFDENELKSIVEQNECGIFTKAGDKDAFKNAILKLYNDRGLCKRYGQNGRRFIMDNLTKEVGTQKYVDVIKSVVKE